MPDSNAKNVKNLHFRAKLPQYFRVAAIAVFALALLAIVIGFYRARSNPEFRMQGFPTNLSKDVIAAVEGYERTEMEGDVRKYFIKADKATTFSDNHQELENVYLQVFADDGQSSDQITAQRAVYIPEENKHFTAYFAGNVNVDTRDSLKVKTEQVTYKKADETASAEEAVEFERDNIRGKTFGAVVKVADKRLELLRDVEIQTFETPESDVSNSTIRAGFAAYDQLNEKIELRDGVDVKASAENNTRFIDVKADSANAFLVAQSENNRDVKKLELFNNVNIETREGDGKPTKINSGYTLYEKDIDRFDLKNGVHIITVEDEKPTDIKSGSAVYEQANGKVFLNGNAEIVQGGDLIKGDHIFAELYPTKKLKYSQVRGNSYLRQIAAERTSEISAQELNAAFNDIQHLQNAHAFGSATTVLTPANATDYSKVTMSAPKAIRVIFKGEGLLDQMSTEGRTTIQLEVLNNVADAANKRVTADTVKAFFYPDGKNMQKADAVGNAELFVEPLRAAAENYKTTVTAPRFDCDFFPTGNNAKNCIAATKTKTVRVPIVSAADRGTQVLTADKLTASFGEQSKDVEQLDAAGNSKFTELDRNAISDNISFTTDDGMTRLRGGEPTVWDSKARAKANEIDWDTRNQKSYLRGGVSTTYYSQQQTGGAAPFGETDRPVFLTAANAEIDHRTEVGVYTGNARGWQENNYVRAEKFIIQQKTGQFDAEGNVQSLLYDAKRKENGREVNVPVYAASRALNYNRDTRLLRYRADVDIRQGADRITGQSADVYLDDKNEVTRTDIENNVVITQPNRKAVADYAQYTVADERVVLRGNPAQVDDSENGSSRGGEMTVYLRDNRVIAEGRSKQNSAGRTRSVYKVKNN